MDAIARTALGEAMFAHNGPAGMHDATLSVKPWQPAGRQGGEG
jgi:hypothetical protein